MNSTGPQILLRHQGQDLLCTSCSCHLPDNPPYHSGAGVASRPQRSHRSRCLATRETSQEPPRSLRVEEELERGRLSAAVEDAPKGPGAAYVVWMQRRQHASARALGCTVQQRHSTQRNFYPGLSICISSCSCSCSCSCTTAATAATAATGSPPATQVLF